MKLIEKPLLGTGKSVDPTHEVHNSILAVQVIEPSQILKIISR
jgi:hypothetical protein